MVALGSSSKANQPEAWRRGRAKASITARHGTKSTMGFDDNRKIGTLLLGIGFAFLVLGVIMFFDAALLALGDVLFLSGVALTIGLSRTIRFFTRKERWRGIVCFLGGIFLVLVRWPIIGMIIQTFGFLNLFGSFFPVAVAFLRQTPVIGTFLNLPVVSDIVDRLAGSSKRGYQRFRLKLTEAVSSNREPTSAPSSDRLKQNTARTRNINMSFFHSLRQRVQQIDSLLCVGLDPHTAELPEATAQAAEAFCLRLIQETHELAAAYKPNSAFFEAFGAEGITALKKVVKAIPAGIPVLLDAKRGDISTTAAAYAVSAFDVLHSHAITLAPYMGRDSIDPFIRGHPERGCFVLCKTSNPSANDFQMLPVSSSRALFEQVALKCEEWNSEDNVGLVVGATDVEALRRVRAVTPNLWILAPGIGAQGGNLEEAVTAGLSADGMGLLVPVSRGISKAANPKQAAQELRDAINAMRVAKVAAGSTSALIANTRQSEFIKFALSFGVLKFGDFTLKSGRKSPYFFNAGLFRTGRALGQLGKFYAQAINDSGIEFDVLFGPAYKGITLAAAVAIAYSELYGVDLPFAYNRKEAKDHGEGGVLVGADMNGQRVLIIDDVITAGTAITEALDILKVANATVSGVCISLDRQEKVSPTDARSAIQRVQESYGIPVVSIANLDNLVAFLEAAPSSDPNAAFLDVIKAYRAEFGVTHAKNGAARQATRSEQSGVVAWGPIIMLSRRSLLSVSTLERVHSNRQIRRKTRHPARLRILQREPQEEIEVPALKYEPTYVPEKVSFNGWSPAPEKPVEGLPFHVKRTAVGLQLPVYRDYRNGRTRVLTILRRYKGNEDELATEMSKVCFGKEVVARPGRLEVTGDHVKDIKQWLTGLGF
ncbi:TPA: hypothetical protein N0F65_009295 [Lagenidium giganteum]|uniref:Orotidine 5'-phosphate decarboxylase n=1 Tax=Lagenidium giganteum TaxID=4803 RepID=A0AAV2YRH2_9STRA|nr:TPA: hypothetical protein N0F65_009295 [Lagenidium giganteum]